MLYCIITDDGLDQVCETKEQAAREMLDLRRMGCDNVKVRPVADWAAANALEEKLNG